MKLPICFLAIVLLAGFVSAACSDEQRIMRLHATYNAHGAVWNSNETDYPVEICYNEIFSADYSEADPHNCTGSNTVLTLHQPANAHAAVIGYPVNVCFGDLVCRYSENAICNPEERCVVTLTAESNAHLAKCDSPNAYTKRICCSSSATSVPNQPPVANLIVNPSSGEEPLDVTFTASCSDPEGILVSCVLDFGDGSTHSFDVSSGSVQSQTQPYTYSEGDYTATLRACNSNSCVTDTAGISVYAAGSPPPTEPSIKAVTATNTNVGGNTTLRVVVQNPKSNSSFRFKVFKENFTGPATEVASLAGSGVPISSGTFEDDVGPFTEEGRYFIEVVLEQAPNCGICQKRSNRFNVLAAPSSPIPETSPLAVLAVAFAVLVVLKLRKSEL